MMVNLMARNRHVLDIAKWDVTSGKFILFTKKLKSLSSFKVSVENGSVYVEE